MTKRADGRCTDCGAAKAVMRITTFHKDDSPSGMHRLRHHLCMLCFEWREYVITTEPGKKRAAIFPVGDWGDD